MVAFTVALCVPLERRSFAFFSGGGAFRRPGACVHVSTLVLYHLIPAFVYVLLPHHSILLRLFYPPPSLPCLLRRSPHLIRSPFPISHLPHHLSQRSSPLTVHHLPPHALSFSISHPSIRSLTPSPHLPTPFANALSSRGLRPNKPVQQLRAAEQLDAAAQRAVGVGRGPGVWVRVFFFLCICLEVSNFFGGEGVRLGVASGHDVLSVVCGAVSCRGHGCWSKRMRWSVSAGGSVCGIAVVALSLSLGRRNARRVCSTCRAIPAPCTVHRLPGLERMVEGGGRHDRET